MRLALLTCLLWCVAVFAHAQIIISAEYNEPTTRYPHGVLGDDVEYGNMVVVVRKERGSEGSLLNTWFDLTYNLRLPEALVFEDLAPRLIDLDGDDKPEIMVVESHQELGARLAIYGLNAEGVPALRSWTPFIGQRNRWLAPVGAADFDGDGVMEFAFVDRPHLARRLVVMSYKEGEIRAGQRLEPVTNHRIGDDYIEGGIRDCGAGPEIIVLNANWTQIVQVVWSGGSLNGRDIAPYAGRESVAAALRCE